MSNKLVDNKKKLDFALTIDRLQNFHKAEVAEFLGVTRQAISYHKRRADKKK